MKGNRTPAYPLSPIKLWSSYIHYRKTKTACCLPSLHTLLYILLLVVIIIEILIKLSWPQNMLYKYVFFLCIKNNRYVQGFMSYSVFHGIALRAISNFDFVYWKKILTFQSTMCVSYNVLRTVLHFKLQDFLLNHILIYGLYVYITRPILWNLLLLSFRIELSTHFFYLFFSMWEI